MSFFSQILPVTDEKIIDHIFQVSWNKVQNKQRIQEGFLQQARIEEVNEEVHLYN